MERRIGTSLLLIGVFAAIVGVLLGGNLFSQDLDIELDALLVHSGVLLALLGLGTLFNPSSTLQSYLTVVASSVLGLFIVTTIVTVITIVDPFSDFLWLVTVRFAYSLSLTPIAVGYLLGLRDRFEISQNTMAWIGIIGMLGWVASYTLLRLWEFVTGDNRFDPAFLLIFTYGPLLITGVVGSVVTYVLCRAFPSEGPGSSVTTEDLM